MAERLTMVRLIVRAACSGRSMPIAQPLAGDSLAIERALDLPLDRMARATL
jgi:hypothetical protein